MSDWVVDPAPAAAPAGGSDWVVDPEPAAGLPMPEEPAAPDVGYLESAARGAGQGATLGFSDELLGLGKALFSDLGDTLSGKDTRGTFAAKYRRERDEEREANRRAREANPFTYGAGELGGSVATSFIPGLGIPKAVGALKTAGHAFKLGAAGGLGTSEAEDIPGQLVDAGLSGLTSGATAGVLHRVMQGAPGRSVARKLGDITDGATATQRDRVVGAAGKRTAEVLDVLKDKSFKKAGRDPAKLLEATENALEETGSHLDAAYQGAGIKTAGIRVQDIIDDVEGIAKRLAKDPGKADVARAVQAKADDIRAAWLPKPEKAPKLPRGSSRSAPVEPRGTPSDEMIQEGLPLPGAKEIKRVKRGEGGKFERGEPIPGYEASGGVGPYQTGLHFGDRANWLKTTAGKDIGAPVVTKGEHYVTAQQVRVLAKDIGDTAFRGSPAVAPKQGQAISQEVWKTLKDRIGRNLDEAAKEGGPARKEIERLNKRYSTLMTMREAVNYRATREATESTRLKDVVGRGIDVPLALMDPSTFVAKKAVQHVGLPVLRGLDDKLAELVTLAQNGGKKAQLAERAALLGLSPMVAQPLINWITRANANLSGQEAEAQAP